MVLQRAHLVPPNHIKSCVFNKVAPEPIDKTISLWVQNGTSDGRLGVEVRYGVHYICYICIWLPRTFWS